MEDILQGVELDAIFDNATTKVRQMAAFLDTQNMLYFYARYKQVKEGPCKIERPGFFDFQGKQKWDAWKNLGEMSKEAAMLEYISQLSSIEPEWEDEMKTGGGDFIRMGIAVSKMSNPDEEISDDCKTIFDWCKDGDHQAVNRILSNEHVDVNDMDDNGLSLLHWACDRGYDEMVKVLLSHQADIDLQDGEKQTALHYAVSCAHTAVVATLLSHGASTKILDSDGASPLHLDTTPEVRQLLLETVK